MTCTRIARIHKLVDNGENLSFVGDLLLGEKAWVFLTRTPVTVVRGGFSNECAERVCEEFEDVVVFELLACEQLRSGVGKFHCEYLSVICA